MNNYWAMKTYEEWANFFINHTEVGIDEDGVNDNYRSYQQDNCPITNPRIDRRFKQFCKWANIGDYVAVGIGQQGSFNLKLIGRIVSDYEFDASRVTGPRHFRKIEVLRVFTTPISIEKWSQLQRLDSLNHNDFLDTLVNYL
jgi:predicted Mrr-cat superfamily restriction endonuclease